MELDHIIIFSQNQGQEADELLRFGLSEGSNRVHPGQGTRNRKFYFGNFFLEIVWVYNEGEIQSEPTRSTGLWERANYKTTGCSPFGFCLAKSDDIIGLFKNSLEYRPVYVPNGRSFSIITNKEYPYLPWTCRLPENYRKKITVEPKNHRVGINNLTRVKFGIPKINYENKFTDFFKNEPKIAFEHATHHSLSLEFDHKKNGNIKKFNDLPLNVTY